MIVFDLECYQGHIFEGWFDGLDSFEDQNSKGLVTCPYCDDTRVRRVMSPVAVRKSSPEAQTDLQSIDYPRLARELAEYLHKNFDDVGPKFAAEALKIHYGVAEKRNIRGSATTDEENTLREEGIEFFKVPLPQIDNEKKN